MRKSILRIVVAASVLVFGFFAGRYDPDPLVCEVPQRCVSEAELLGCEAVASDLSEALLTCDYAYEQWKYRAESCQENIMKFIEELN